MMNVFYSIYLLALSSGIYSGFSKFALSMWLRDGGADLMLLNLFTWTMFPAIFKPFWMPFLENYEILKFKFGIKKNLIIICDILILLMTICLPFFPIKTLTYVTKLALVVFLIIYASIIASRDSISIGYKMEFISKDAISEYEGMVSAWYQIGMIAGGAALFYCSEFVSWNYLFVILCGVFGINLLLDFFMANSTFSKKEKLKFSEKFSKPYVELINENKNMIIALISFLMFYKLADRMLVGNLNYYMLDAGLTKSTLAFLKLATGWMVVVMSIASIYITRVLGLKQTLIVSLILYILVPMFIYLNIVFNIFGINSKIALCTLYILDKMLKAIQGNVFFAFQMQFCSKENAMSQTALLSFFEKGFCMALAPVMGFILQHYGYETFFLVVILTFIPSLISCLVLFKAKEKIESKN